MVEIYVKEGGMAPPDAALVIDTLFKYPRFFGALTFFCV